MKNKDERMKTMNEILNGIKVRSGVRPPPGSSCTPLLGALYLEAAHLPYSTSIIV